MTRPVGCGVIRSAVFVDLGQRTSLGNRSSRSLRGGSLVARIPGNELPGYHHPVPPGRSVAHSPIRYVALSPR